MLTECYSSPERPRGVISICNDQLRMSQIARSHNQNIFNFLVPDMGKAFSKKGEARTLAKACDGLHACLLPPTHAGLVRPPPHHQCKPGAGAPNQLCRPTANVSFLSTIGPKSREYVPLCPRCQSSACPQLGPVISMPCNKTIPKHPSVQCWRENNKSGPW